jgi:flavin-dependent dehydrogenase
MKWLHCGPLVFRNRLHEPATERVYPAGDALSFVDPFTGSGILSALLTGELAGASAAEALPASRYLTRCADILQTPFEVSSIFRAIARTGWAGWMAGLVPGEWLFRWTRPRSA